MLCVTLKCCRALWHVYNDAHALRAARCSRLEVRSRTRARPAARGGAAGHQGRTRLRPGTRSETVNRERPDPDHARFIRAKGPIRS
eukprot:4722114-Prymnesium_polylepis.1